MSSADRFEVARFHRWGPAPGVDRVTGARVLVVERPAGAWPVRDAVDVAALRVMAERVVALAHPRVARVVSLDPVVVEAGPERESQPALLPVEWARIADQLASTLEALFEQGVVWVDPSLAWVERRPDGQAEVRVPAPTAQPGFNLVRWRDRLADIARWVVQGSGSDELGQAIEQRMLRRPTATDAPLPPPPLDFDLAIRLGEAELARVDELEGRRAESSRPYVTLPLGAAYHHRACVAWSQGDRELALRDVARAIEVDPHARYATTAALWHEALGNREAAADHHARAVAALREPTVFEGIVVLETGDDRPERFARDAVRTRVARAAFLSREGRYDEALAELERAVAHEPTAYALAWLSSVRRRLGDREGAREAAERALALEPASAAAARMLALA